MAGEVALSEDAPGLLQRLAAWWPREAAEAVRIALTAIAAIWLAMWLELALPHWAGWTVISVTLATRAASLRKSLWRAGSTLVGVTVAMVLVANFAQATLAFDLALALWMGLLTAASSVESGQRAYGFASMGFTVPIIALADVQNPEAVFQIGVDRCSTILLGIGCAYASNVFVAPGVPAVSRALAGRLEAAAEACDAWMAALRRGERPGPMPIAAVMTLGEEVTDTFTEQPSLRSGGRGIRNAAPRLRRVLAAGLLRALLPDRSGSRSTDLIGAGGAIAVRQVGRVRVSARLLRAGGRVGRRRVPFRPHLLLWNDLDWDGWHAFDNALRTAAAVLLVNGFWYVTGWSHGAGAATWASLVCVLLAAHADPRAESRAFLVGALLAGVVGLTVRYTLLTTTGSFALLAAVLLPVAMLAVVGRADKRAIYGIGFGFFVFGVLDPKNPMTYDLADSLNTVLAELLGMAVAAIAFAALPPPVSAATLRLRARRRLVRSVRGAALDPALLLPPLDRYLARGFGRLALIGADDAAARSGERLLVIGLLLLALRETDDREGRRVGRAVWARLAESRPAGPETAPDPLRALADRATLPLQAERIGALAALVSDLDRAGWPNLDPGGRA
ncbi:Uncharacterized membrane protein YccC [Methylobacterium sp. UNC300MFChir4.1]|uniref:FUSC family protein n=1 Tax=Methylobacterium sp. UNC300MFChir4.1 TaxID=1502747 RepID=UPI0008AD0E89|nr:FUSC family protein [Methylobacterium sp. UNC300MFChir4.1]SEN83826.1 Uncharacterized membrane protein YccC [Methylobacterium sp. UNC300MFChir4.1]